MRKALDLFCGAGGVTKGLQRAGFYVVGVDIKPQPRYCGDEFYQADALTFPLEGYDFIWASPPCQAYSIAASRYRQEGKEYVDLVGPIRERLKGSGKPFVIENVPFSPLVPDLILCGSYFGLEVVRHRWFEIGFQHHFFTQSCNHAEWPITVCGDGTPSWARAKRMAAGLKDFTQADKKRAMGIDWMSRRELSQAIPPAYSEFIGRQAMAILTREFLNADL